MSHAVLEEQFVALPPRAPSRLAEPSWNAGQVATRSSREQAPPPAALGATGKRRSGVAETLRTVRDAALWTLRAVGAVLGIVVASLTVAVLVVVQRVLHLG